MPVEELTCPNCGASLQVADDQAITTCAYCGASLRIAVDSPERRTVTVQHAPLASGIDLDRVKMLIAEGRKIEAIKAFRQQTGAGLKESKDAVEAIERGEPFAIPPRHITTRARPIRYTPAARFGAWGCWLYLALIIAACVGLFALSGHVMFRAFGPFDQAMDRVRSDPKVVEAFGTPINPGLFVMGGIGSSGPESHAQFETPIYGSRQSGMMYARGTWRSGKWDLSIYITYTRNDEEREIFIEGER
jgi:hypothetical protein